VQAAAHALGLDISSEFRRAEEILPAIEKVNGRAEALYICADPLVHTNAVSINALALAARLPVMHSFRENVEAGGLVSYGPDRSDLYRRAADLVDKILRGTPPTSRSSNPRSSGSSSTS
jgi:putative tryptophan/tyrosine transport system substrate-binding protein